MNALSATIIIVFSFISFIPVINLFRYQEYKQYRVLRYLVSVSFLWSILMLAYNLYANLYFVYYAQMLVYPIIFLFVYLSHETIQSFIGKKSPFILHPLAIGFFVVNLTMSLTNSLHQLVMKVRIGDVARRSDIVLADYGIFFYIHTYISYAFVSIVIVKLIYHLAKKRTLDYGSVPLIIVLSLVIAGFSINILHVFFIRIEFSPTYMIFVIFAYFLYWLVFTKDFQLRLLSGSRNVLINAMREMYIIATKDGEVVEYSKALLNRFDIEKRHTKNLDNFLRELEEKTVMYKTFSHIKDDPYIDKPYLYTIKKDFIIPGFKETGKLILMYDETRLMELVDQLNYYIKYDAMTNCFHRNHFEKNRETYEFEHPNAGVVISDLNGLKLFNDHFGHSAGDDLIKRYVEILKTFENDSTMIFRMGGDEFLVFVTETNKKSLTKLKKAILEATTSTDFKEHISVSLGSALRQADESLEETIRRADDELYETKSTLSKTYQNEFKAWLKHNKGDF